MARGVSANCPQTMTQLLFPQLLPELSHLLPNPFHILFSHPCLWISKPLNHIPSILQDGLPNTEPPTISSRYTIFTSFQREGQGLSFISILLLFILFFIVLVGLFHVEIFYCLFLFGRHCSWAYPCRLVFLPILAAGAPPGHLDPQTCRGLVPLRLRLLLSGPPPASTPSGPPGADARRERAIPASPGQ